LKSRNPSFEAEKKNHEQPKSDEPSQVGGRSEPTYVLLQPFRDHRIISELICGEPGVAEKPQLQKILSASIRHAFGMLRSINANDEIVVALAPLQTRDFGGSEAGTCSQLS